MRKIKLILYSLLGLIVASGLALFLVFEFNNIEGKTLNEEGRSNAGGKFIQLTEGITHYEIAGPDTGKVVILVHGFSVPYYIWNGTFDSLAEQGFRVMRYDEFGRGYSDRPDVTYSPALYRKQLLELINSLKLTTPVSLAGVSFGGGVVTDFAVHYSSMVDKIILVDPVFGFKNPPVNELVVNFNLALNHEKQAAGQLDDFKYPERFPDWKGQYKIQMEYKGFRNALASTLINYPADSIVANYHQLDSFHKKVLLIWGKEDQTVAYRFSDSLQRILKADFFPVDDARHLPQLEKPLIVNQKIISFLK